MDSQASALDIGRVLSRGVQTIGRQFLIFTGVAFLFVGIPAFLLQQFLPTPDANPADLATFLNPWLWVTVLINLLLSFLLQAALVRASILDLRGEPINLGQVLIDALKLLLPMIGLTILMSLAIGFGFVLLIVPGIILYIMWIVAVPVLVEERLGVFGSLERSAELTKGSRWWILLLLLIYLIASSVVGYVSIWAIGGLRSMPVVATILLVIINTLSAMVIAAMLASLYLELRLVKDSGTEGGLAEIFA